MPWFVNTWLWFFWFSRIYQRLSTFVNAYFFIKVIGILELICCQRCQPRNVCILFFIVLLVKTKIPHTLVHCWLSFLSKVVTYMSVGKNPGIRDLKYKHPDYRNVITTGFIVSFIECLKCICSVPQQANVRSWRTLPSQDFPLKFQPARFLHSWWPVAAK